MIAGAPQIKTGHCKELQQEKESKMVAETI
jgi:hypothetical protein